MFGTVEIKARPLKLAYLVDPSRPNQVRQAIQLSSSLWGGVYSPIVPLYRRMPATWKDVLKAPMAKAVVLGYLEAFDPDILVQLCSELPPYVSETSRRIVRGHEIRPEANQGRRPTPRFGIGIFEVLKSVFDEHFRYKAKYPVKVLIPRLRGDLQLFWASWFGELPPDLWPIVERRYSEPLEIEAPEFTPDKIGELMGESVLFPRRLSQYQLKVFGRSSLRGGASVYFMDASSLEDVVDFWNLRATGRAVLPLPKQLKDKPQMREVLERFLRDHRRHWPHQRTVCDMASIIRSRHSTMEELQEYAKGVTIERDPADPSKDGFFTLQHWYPRIWDEWARDKDGAVPGDTYAEEEREIEIPEPQSRSIRFKPVLPGFADAYAANSEIRCANEIGFRFYGANEHIAEVFPQSGGKHLERAISGITSFRDWRVGRHGLVRLVQHDFAETRDIPLGEAVMFAWLADNGWTPKISSAGLLAKLMYRQLEGHVALLMEPQLLGLLEHMNGGRVGQDATPLDDRILEQERDLTVGEVKNRINRFTGRRGNLYDQLLSKEVFRLGLRVQCPQCSRNSWFSLDGIGATLTCPRCLREFAAAGTIDRAQWSYKTTGPFSVPHYADGAYAVLLTLRLFSAHRNDMRMTPALSFTAKRLKEELEADFAFLWEESLYGERRTGVAFGECKTYGRFEERDFTRMSRLAEAFPGAALVFSTLRKSLDAKEVKALTRIARAGRKYWKAERPINPVLILTATELFNWRSAPDCWSEALQETFKHFHGVLALCDATQQIHLKLPSWETEWHQAWDKKYQKKRAAKEGGKMSDERGVAGDAAGARDS